jgi:hypothetical protein
MGIETSIADEGRIPSKPPAAKWLRAAPEPQQRTAAIHLPY